MDASTYRGGIQVSEGGSGRRVCQVIRGHVHGLHGGDGPLVGRRDALLPGVWADGQRGRGGGGETRRKANE